MNLCILLFTYENQRNFRFVFIDNFLILNENFGNSAQFVNLSFDTADVGSHIIAGRNGQRGLGGISESSVITELACHCTRIGSDGLRITN